MKLFVLFILVTIGSTAIGQTTKTSKKLRTLTYYYWGDAANGFYIDTEPIYGFRMKWKKCIVKNRQIRHNERVEKKINDRLGVNWLAENIHKLEIGYKEEE